MQSLAKGGQLETLLDKLPWEEVGSWAAGNRKEAEIRGGVRGAVKVADVEVKGQVGVGVRVLREETVARPRPGEGPHEGWVDRSRLGHGDGR